MGAVNDGVVQEEERADGSRQTRVGSRCIEAMHLFVKARLFHAKAFAIAAYSEEQKLQLTVDKGHEA